MDNIFIVIGKKIGEYEQILMMLKAELQKVDNLFDDVMSTCSNLKKTCHEEVDLFFMALEARTEAHITKIRMNIEAKLCSLNTDYDEIGRIIEIAAGAGNAMLGICPNAWISYFDSLQNDVSVEVPVVKLEKNQYWEASKAVKPFLSKSRLVVSACYQKSSWLYLILTACYCI